MNTLMWRGLIGCLVAGVCSLTACGGAGPQANASAVGPGGRRRQVTTRAAAGQDAPRPNVPGAAPAAPLASHEVGPSHWGEVLAHFEVVAQADGVHALLAPMAARCADSGGAWHSRHVSCRCPNGQLFVASSGCLPAPAIVSCAAGCSDDWPRVPTACLRHVQAGPLAWRLHFAGRRNFNAQLRDALARGAWTHLLAEAVALPEDGAVSLHFTAQLGVLRADDVLPQTHQAMLWPTQYNVLASPLARQTSPRRPVAPAVHCRRRLATSGELATDVIGALCAGLTHAMAHIEADDASGQAADSRDGDARNDIDIDMDDGGEGSDSGGGSSGRSGAPKMPRHRKGGRIKTDVDVRAPESARAGAPSTCGAAPIASAWPAPQTTLWLARRDDIRPGEMSLLQRRWNDGVCWRIHMRAGAVLSRALAVAVEGPQNTPYMLYALFDAMGRLQALVVQPEDVALRDALVIVTG